MLIGDKCQIASKNILARHRFQLAKNDPPTQAADFVAYEVRQAYTALEVKSGEIFEKFRMSFVLLGQIPGRWGDLKDQDIRAELNVRKIPKRKPLE